MMKPPLCVDMLTMRDKLYDKFKSIHATFAAV